MASIDQSVVAINSKVAYIDSSSTNNKGITFLLDTSIFKI
jgi:hypothetical protein